MLLKNITSYIRNIPKPLAFTFCSKPTVPKTRKINIGTSEFIEHRDEIHIPDETKYREAWQNESSTHNKRLIPKGIADDRYLFDKGIIPRKQLMSCYYSVEKDGRVYHVFNAENIYWFDMVNHIAHFIRGKHKPIYKNNQSRHGDTVIVVNAMKCKMHGKRLKFWRYHYHSGYPGGMKERLYKNEMFKRPEMLLFKDVNRALPKNNLREIHLKNLKVYRGNTHNYKSFLPHFAERPPIDKIALLPDGHFEEIHAKAREGIADNEGWGGSPYYDYETYKMEELKKEALEDEEGNEYKTIVKREELNKYNIRAKKYFAYLRKTADYRPRPPRDRRQEFLDVHKNNKYGSAQIFMNDEEVQKYKMDWIIDECEQDSSSGED